MAQIWKFELAPTDCQQFEMPKDAKIISVQTQHGVICLWALVNNTEETEQRCFRIVGTGHECEETLYDAEFLGTIQLHGGDLIFHVFFVGAS